MQIAYKAANILEAHIVAGMLNAYDIATYVSGYYLQGAVGDISAMGFANVFVKEADFAKASPLIAEYEAGNINLPEPFDNLEQSLYQEKTACFNITL